MARSITGRDESFCLDVVQECMMRVIRSMPALPDEPSVTAWMGRATFTTAVDALRSERRRASRERAVVEKRSARVDDTSDRHADERFEWIRRRLAELPAADRELVLSRFERGDTLRTIGDAHGISGNAVHGRIYRVVHRLRKAAKEFFGD